MMNRWAFYGLTFLSCALLVGIFWSRGQTVWAVIVAAVAVLYVVRGIISTRNEKLAHRQTTVETMSKVHTNAQRQAVLADLRTSRTQLRGARQRTTLIGVLVAIAAVWTYPTSGPVAFTISALLVPIGFIIVRNSRAIGVIERGLTQRGLSLD